MTSREEREGRMLGRAEVSWDQPSEVSPRPWRKRMADFWEVLVLVVVGLVSVD